MGLFCLLREFLSQIEKKKIPNAPKNENGLTLLIMMGESIRHKRVKLLHPEAS